VPALGAVSACSVGSGVGAASGDVYVYGCSSNGDFGTQKEPVHYDLKPTFFAGEPIDDLREYGSGTEIRNNRLIIRLQSSGKQIEYTDVLTFDVAISYEVARCVRGRVDTSTGTPINDWGPDCYRASDDGPGRMRLQWDSSVRASLTLKSTCPVTISKMEYANLVADAVSAPVPQSYATAPRPSVSDGNWDSWIEFKELGGASQYNRTPDKRDQVKPDYRVAYGDRIYATAFSLTLIDDGVVNAAMNNLPKPDSSIGGTMQGWFDFDLRRGQGAQSFP
jgi:hypothetical protein